MEIDNFYSKEHLIVQTRVNMKDDQRILNKYIKLCGASNLYAMSDEAILSFFYYFKDNPKLEELNLKLVSKYYFTKSKPEVVLKIVKVANTLYYANKPNYEFYKDEVPFCYKNLFKCVHGWKL